MYISQVKVIHQNLVSIALYKKCVSGDTSTDTQMAGPSPVPPFADKTYAIVDGESDDIVSWAVDADGEDTFVIKESTIFQDRILPRYFNHSNYSSFTRQLNNYGEAKQ